MTISAQKCAESAMKFGADSYSIWTPADLSPEWKETQAALMNADRGPFWWAWKPYIVHREMCRAKDGDYVIYADAGNEWVADMRSAIAAMDQDILFFSNGWRHVDWCKMDCLHEILDRFNDHRSYSLIDVFEDHKEEQVQASTFFVRVTPETRRFIQEWYGWSMIPGMIDNEPSKLENIHTFREHRHDQAILTCLQIKYGYSLHWFPSTVFVNQWHKFPNDHYPAMLNHHRRRNADWANL